MAAAAPRVVVLARASELDALLARHGTREQARFFLERRGQSIAEAERRHARQEAALLAVSRAIPVPWRRVRIDRRDLAAFVFEPGDVVLAVGQDGLVANAAKYLAGQAVVGVNPDPDRHDGILAQHRPERVARLLPAVAAGRAEVEERTLAEARLDDGQRLLGLNEVFAGHRSHQSARYRIRHAGAEERQSSSGVIVTTGTGATGWARSVNGERRAPVALPSPVERGLAFLVREPFPSVSTGTSLDAGVLGPGEAVELVSEMHEGGVAFADGIEEDRLELAYGTRLTVAVAAERLRLVRAA